MNGRFIVRHAIGLIAAVFSLCFASAAQAAEAPESSPYGAWQGTIGKYPVAVLLTDKSCNRVSSYYYLRHLTAIHLAQNYDIARTWNENWDGKGAAWTLASVTDDAIGGTWTSADGKRTLPISLKRIAEPSAAPYSGNQCEAQFAAYNKVRIDRIMKKMVTKNATLGALRYRTLSVMNGKIVYFEVLPGAQHVSGLNKAMRDGMQSEIADALECHDHQDGYVSRYETAVRPTRLLYGHILTIQNDYTHNCGAGLDNSSAYGGWDVDTDTPIFPGAWVNTEKYTYDKVKLSDKLKALIQQHAAAGKGECSGILTAPDTAYSVSFGSSGLVFHTRLPAAKQACNQEIEIPFAELMPFLTPEGQQTARQLMQEAQQH